MALKDKLQAENIWQFIKDHEQDNPAHLVLRQPDFHHIPIQELAAQIAARQKAKMKLPEWHAQKVWFPPKVSLEQCSSEATARFKASLLSGKSFADLTGGFGIDTYYLSQQFEECHYVEQEQVLCELAAYNFHVLNQPIEVHQAQSEEFLEKIEKPLDWVYLDPARRGDRAQKVFLWQDCSPNITTLLPQLFASSKNVMVKAAPMQDISRGIAELENKVKAVYIIEWQKEVKELLYILSPTEVEEVRITAVSLSDVGDVLTTFAGNKSQETVANVYYQSPQKYLYEPSPAVMKSGLYKLLGGRFELGKLHANTQLFTSNQLRTDFPGRIFELKSQIPVQKKQLKQVLPEMKANLSTRNFPMPIAQLKKKLAITDGGAHYLFATTLKDDVKALLVCEKLTTPVGLY